MKEENKRLTDDQKKQIPFYLEKWQNIAISTKAIDRQEVKEAVNYFYQFSNFQQPNILFFDSPWGAIEYLLEDNDIQLGTAIDFLLGLSKFKSQVIYEDYDPDNELNNLGNLELFELKIKELLSLPIETNINHILQIIALQKTLDHKLHELKLEIGESTYFELIHNPQNPTKIPPENFETGQKKVDKLAPHKNDGNNPLKIKKSKEVQSLVQFQFIPEYRDNIFSQKLAGYCAAIDFKISVLNYPFDLEKWKILATLVKNCSCFFPFDKICLVSARPSKILLDSEQRLHAEAENAIQFADGWLKKYYHHGIAMPEEYGKIHPSKWKSKWILSEKNAELRRVLIEAIGYEKSGCCASEVSSELSSTKVKNYPQN